MKLSDSLCVLLYTSQQKIATFYYAFFARSERWHIMSCAYVFLFSCLISKNGLQISVKLNVGKLRLK